MRSGLLYLSALAVWAAAAAAAETGPLPDNVLKPKSEGRVPTAAWLAECEALFEDVVAARRELDEILGCGDPTAATLADVIHNRTAPSARRLADFCSAYTPDTAWGQQLRQEVIDAMVSSLAADAQVIEILEGQAESHVPLADLLAEQRDMRDALLTEVGKRLQEAPSKYRMSPEELTPSREFYFQDFKRRFPKTS